MSSDFRKKETDAKDIILYIFCQAFLYNKKF